jgi:hypothetical protein
MASLAFIAGTLAAPVAAQSIAVTGIVTDRGGQPVAFAEIHLLPDGPTVHAGADGQFTFGSLAVGEDSLRVRRFGYVPLTFRLTVGAGLKPLEIVLEPAPEQLDTIRRIALEQDLPRVFDRARKGISALAFGPELMKEFPGYSADDMLTLDSDLWHQLLGASFCGIDVYIDGKPMRQVTVLHRYSKSDLGIRYQLRMRDIAAIEAIRVPAGIHEPWIPPGIPAEGCRRSVLIWTKGFKQQPYHGP